MSSDRLNSTFSELEVQLFVEKMDEIPEHKEVSEIICDETADYVKAITFGAVRRAITNLGALRSRQYHRIPLSNSRYEVLLDFDTPDEDGSPQRFRATANETRDIKGEIKSVELEDYAVGLHALSVVHRQSSQLLKGPPNDLLEGTLPVIWRCNQGPMARYAGPGYSLDAAAPLTTMNFSELTQQLTAARAFSTLLGRLSREVTLEEEYSY